MNDSRSSFTGRLGFVLAAAGSAVGLGNIWRFPYLAARYGGGVFLFVYIVLALTFGYSMMIAETAIGRASGKSPVGAFRYYAPNRAMIAGGWLNAVISMLIIPYYSVVGGWVFKYLIEFIHSDITQLAEDTYFSSFISQGWQAEMLFLVFTAIVLFVIGLGVREGLERVTRVVMPLLVILAVIICVYTITRPGALEGVRYFLIPDFSRFSWMTVVAAMGQMFYSLSIAVGILITFGSYMQKDVSIESSTVQVEVFDTAMAILAGLIIIPAVFAFSGTHAAESLNAGPSLMFITMPKIFASMTGGRYIGILFFTLVLIAALTSAFSLAECAISTFMDEFGWNRSRSIAVLAVIIAVLGSLCCLGYGPLSFITLIGMPFLDFFDFLSNSVMMPLAALTVCLLINRHMTIQKAEEEIVLGGAPFRRRNVFRFMITYVCPVFVFIVLLSSLAEAFGIIHF